MKLLNKDENNFMIKAYRDDKQIGYVDFLGSDMNILKFLFKETNNAYKKVFSYEKVLSNKTNLILM